MRSKRAQSHNDASSAQLGFETLPQAKLAAVRKFLSIWRHDSCKGIRGIVKVFDDETSLTALKAALQSIRGARVLRFDPYIISGYRPSENQMSNALKVILDPNGIHGLGFLGLNALLDSVSIHELDESLRRKVEAARSSLTSKSRFELSREYFIETGRIDIRIDIQTSGGQGLLVYIENKKTRDAYEIGETPQTVRYERILLEKEKEGIVGFGIFLTPDEKQPRSSLFIPISCQSFADSLCKRLSNERLSLIEESRSTVLMYAFALTYGWIN